MPAWPAERLRAIELGIHVMILARPVGYVSDRQGKLTGVQCVRTELGEPDTHGRRSSVDVPDSTFMLEADTAIEAIGQRLDEPLERALIGLERTPSGTIAVNAATQMTSRAGVFAGGDLTNSHHTVIHAIADGQRAAEGIADYIASYKA